MKNLFQISYKESKKPKKIYIGRDDLFGSVDLSVFIDNQSQIMIMGSLLEKEALDNDDKRLVSSVIFNRLNKDMKLQIDASVLFSITDGKYNLGRKLSFDDLN